MTLHFAKLKTTIKNPDADGCKADRAAHMPEWKAGTWIVARVETVEVGRCVIPLGGVPTSVKAKAKIEVTVRVKGRSGVVDGAAAVRLFNESEKVSLNDISSDIAGPLLALVFQWRGECYLTAMIRSGELTPGHVLAILERDEAHQD